MPESDSRLVEVLDRVAASGRAASHPAAPDQIRHIANRRSVRKRALLGAGAVGVIAVGSLVGISIGDTSLTVIGPATQHTTTIQPPDATGVPDSVLLSKNDDAVRAALGDPEGTEPSLAKIPRLDPLCNVPYDDVAPGTLVTRSPQIVGVGNGSGIVLEFVSRYSSEATATAAVASAIRKIGRCPATARLEGTMHELDISHQTLDTVQGWSGTITDQSFGPPTNRHTAVLRRGSLVAYLRIDSGNKNFSDDEASAIVKAAAEHLQSAN